MILYAIILLVVAALCAGLAIAIYCGKTNLIHDYHQSKVSDPAAYGRAFGKAMFVVAASLFASATIALFGESAPIGVASIATLFGGLAIGIACIILVQKKYNRGIF